jgi:hypothetical protein
VTFAPLPERLDALTGRLEAIPAYLAEHRTRAVVPQVQLWQALELETARGLPSFFDVIVQAGRGAIGDAAQGRLERAAETAAAAVGTHAEWLTATLATAVDDWALGRETYDELVRLRAFDVLDSDAILELGYAQLAENKAARVAAAREIDPTVDEPTIVDRIKSDHPATFDEALEAYRDAMLRARRHLIERDIVSVPDDERLEVIPTPEYLRNLIPFAAYFDRPSSTATRPASTSSPRPSATTRTRCASTTGARSATRASTRRTRATTSSSRWRPAIRR